MPVDFGHLSGILSGASYGQFGALAPRIGLVAPAVGQPAPVPTPVPAPAPAPAPASGWAPAVVAEVRQRIDYYGSQLQGMSTDFDLLPDGTQAYNAIVERFNAASDAHDAGDIGSAMSILRQGVDLMEAASARIAAAKAAPPAPTPPPVTAPPVPITPTPVPTPASAKTIRVVARAKTDGRALPSQARYWIGLSTTSAPQAVVQFTGTTELLVPLTLVSVRVHSPGFKPMTRVVDLRGATPDIGPGVSGFRSTGFLTLANLQQAAEDAPIEVLFELEDVVVVEPLPIPVAPSVIAPAPVYAEPAPAAPPVVPTALPPEPVYVAPPLPPPPIVAPTAPGTVIYVPAPAPAPAPYEPAVSYVPPLTQVPAEFSPVGPTALDSTILSLPGYAAPLAPTGLVPTGLVPSEPLPSGPVLPPVVEAEDGTINIFGLKIPKTVLYVGGGIAALLLLMKKKGK